ncbi:MAG: hypothetical protein LBQ30_06080 [Treponema sp.]|nr:hypothetical protein [Treponema sp.]
MGKQKTPETSPKTKTAGKGNVSPVTFPVLMCCALLLAACTNGMSPNAEPEGDSSLSHSFIAVIDYTEAGPDLTGFVG